MIVIWILLNLMRQAPLHYKLARTESSLAPINIVEAGSKSCQRFKNLNDNLPALKTVTHKATDNAKFQFEEFQLVKIIKNYFLSFKMKKDCLDVFLHVFS